MAIRFWLSVRAFRPSVRDIVAIAVRGSLSLSAVRPRSVVMIISQLFGFVKHFFLAVAFVPSVLTWFADLARCPSCMRLSRFIGSSVGLRLSACLA